MIVKVQVPITTNEKVPQAFIYDETRDFQALVPVDDLILKIMKGEYKKFFKASLIQKEIILGEEVDDPGW